MFALYKTVHPPTGIDNAIFCSFTGPKEKNLITSSANRLQVYKLCPENSKSKKLKLECVESFNLFGNISSMINCRYGSMNKDALILAFDDAKLSIVEYDSFSGDLVTLSIHYFENELEKEGVHYNIYHPILRVDPNMRCAVMLIYGCKLVVIPFHEDHSNQNNTAPQQADVKDSTLFDSSLPIVKSEPELDFKNSSINNPNEINLNQRKGFSSSSLSSYTIDLRKLDDWLEMRIIDIEFLYGYYEPTLFILNESNRTWVGRYAVKKDTCNSVALSLNLQQKTHPIIWPVDKLPSDCVRCVAVPPPIGGILLFAVNSLIYINQSIPSYGISLNSIARTTSSYPFKNMEQSKITLDCSHSVFVAPDRLIVSLKGGEIYILTLLTDSESLRSVRSFHIEKGPGSVIASCLTKCSENYLFVGSRLGNSILLKYNVKVNANKTMPSSITNGFGLKAKESIKSKSDDGENKEDNENDENDEDLDDYENDPNLKSDLLTSDGRTKNSESYASDELDEILEKTEGKLNSSSEIISYTFEICDMLLNVAPCGHSIIGESVGDYSEFDTDNIQYHIDLVTSSGHSKNGAISVLQRSLRPEIIASFQIPDIIDMWSVFGDLDAMSSSTFLFLSKPDSTMVLQMANEITELEKESSAFCTKLPTIFCSNLVNNQYIMQITTNSCIIYYDCSSETGAKILLTYDLLPLLDSKIKHATICDPFAGILTENGSIFVFLFNENDKKLELFNKGETNLNSVSCFTLFKDECGIFSNANRTIELENNTDSEKRQEMSNKNPLIDNKHATGKINNADMNDEMNVDDEDELLYGTTKTDLFTNNETASSFINKLLTDASANNTHTKANNFNTFQSDISFENENQSQQQNLLNTSRTIQATYWLITVTNDGVLSVYSLNENVIQLFYNVPKFNLTPKLLTMNDVLKLSQSSSISSITVVTPRSSLMDTHQPTVHEILMVATGYEKSRVYLVSKIDEDLIVYEAFIGYPSNQFGTADPTNTNTQSLNGQLNFKRVNHDIVVRDRKRRKTQNRKVLNEFGDSRIGSNLNAGKLAAEISEIRTKFTTSLRPFNNIAGLGGFFITGVHSYFVFICPRSGFTPHPIWIDGSINSFVPLKNSSITLQGFIYLNKNFDIRICTLPTEDCEGKLQIYYDSPWVLRKVQLRQTVHFLCYHEESKSYAAVTSISETTNKLMQLGGEDKELETFEKDENFILPTRSQFFIQLYASNVWEPLPLGKYTLVEWEHVSSLKIVSLPYEGHSSGYRAYLAASTINCYNEDVNSRGKVIIFDVIETVPEPDKPLTATKMKIILEKEQKGPVTCIESVNGYLLGGVGQKIFIWEYKNNELIGKAFIDTHFYIHKMVTLKNFVLIADLHHSISLIRFQQEYTKLSYVAKDKQITDTYACEYLVDNTNLAFIATDAEKNLSIYMYQNESYDNQGGHWLVRKAEFNVGSLINSMFRLKCKVNDPNLDKRSSLADKRQVTYCTTLDGSIGFILPISEKTFRRLFILQNAMFVMKSHYAGLNPKSYRIWKTKRQELGNHQKNILDGDLLFEYFNLSFADRNEIAKK